MQYPFPIPFGWFQVLWSDELAPGDVRPLFYFDEHLVAWRDENGEAHIQEAFCPHLGAHLGHGGKVRDCQIECPFHGWTFDAEGANAEIPYAERTNRKARLRTYPVTEVNGLIMAWYHPDEKPPMWDIPELEPFTATEGYSEVTHKSYEIGAHWQELAENGVDSAHFRYVHDTADVPVLEAYEADGHHSKMRSVQHFVTPQGTTEGRIDVDSFGPGLSFVRFSGIVDTFLMGCNTPLTNDTCVMRFTFVVRDIGEGTSTVGDAFVAEIDKQVEEDRPVWENKAHLVRPALASTDGPFMKFRKWAGQFYAEGVDDQTEVWAPDDARWDDLKDYVQRPKGTAAARHGDRN